MTGSPLYCLSGRDKPSYLFFHNQAAESSTVILLM